MNFSNFSLLPALSALISLGALGTAWLIPEAGALLQVSFVLTGLAGGLGLGQALSSQSKERPALIDPRKLAQELASDERKMLEEKVKTLSLALDKLSKRE